MELCYYMISIKPNRIVANQVEPEGGRGAAERCSLGLAGRSGGSDAVRHKKALTCLNRCL